MGATLTSESRWNVAWIEVHGSSSKPLLRLMINTLNICFTTKVAFCNKILSTNQNNCPHHFVEKHNQGGLH